MEWSGDGVVIGVRRHGESDAIVEALTEQRGRHLGLVRGGRSRRLRPVLQPGNTLALTWRARLHDHLGNFQVEPRRERFTEMTRSPLAAFALGLAAAHLRLLPERDPHPRLYRALEALLDCMDRPALAAGLMARFELILLDELGFGLDLSACAATGRPDDLAFVSPRSGRAVCREAAAPYADRLLPLPGFLLQPAGDADAEVSAEGLQASFLLTGYFLERHVFDARGDGLPEIRLSFLRAVDTAWAEAA